MQLLLLSVRSAGGHHHVKPRALFITRFRTCVVEKSVVAMISPSVGRGIVVVSPIVGRGIVVGIYDEQNRMGNSNNKGFLILKRDVVLGEELRWKYDQTQSYRDKAPLPSPTGTVALSAPLHLFNSTTSAANLQLKWVYGASS